MVDDKAGRAVGPRLVESVAVSPASEKKGAEYPGNQFLKL